MTTKRSIRTLITAALTCTLLPYALLAQGPLAPPGVPAPMFKTLHEVEPRTPVTNLPFTISQRGSYYLTTNLTGVASANGITVNANPVTLDLNGFALMGMPGSLNGIYVNGTEYCLEVRNGSIRDWGEHAIQAASGAYCRFSDLRIYANDGDGLRAGNGATISDCTIYQNGTNGIYTGEGAQITDCNVHYNNGHGVALSYGGIVRDCITRYNSLDGIRVNARLPGAAQHL